jgi:nitrate reductase alpha subunit
MPMHQTDTLFHKAKVKMGYIFGGETDNHAVNTVPKETLVRITKAKDGGIGGKGPWEPGTSVFTPENMSSLNQQSISGGFIKVVGGYRHRRDA